MPVGRYQHLVGGVMGIPASDCHQLPTTRYIQEGRVWREES